MEMRNSITNQSNRILPAENHISKVEDKIIQVTNSNEVANAKRNKRLEDNVRCLMDNSKMIKLQIIEIPKKRKKRQRRMIGWKKYYSDF